MRPVARGLCSDPHCPGRAAYSVSIPRSANTIHCKPHTKRAIREATRSPCYNRDLDAMLEATVERDLHTQRRGRRHVHWPALGERMDDVASRAGGQLKPKVDTAVCGATPSIGDLAQFPEDVTCPRCQKEMAHHGKQWATKTQG